MLRADSIDAAVALEKGRPLPVTGGMVEVSRTRNVMSVRNVMSGRTVAARLGLRSARRGRLNTPARAPGMRAGSRAPGMRAGSGAPGTCARYGRAVDRHNGQTARVPHRLPPALAGVILLALIAACSGAGDAPGSTSRPTPTRATAGSTVIASQETALAPIGATETARVVRVVDGDTIIIDRGRGNERLRYIGMDTPESVKPNTPVQFMAKEAAVGQRGAGRRTGGRFSSGTSRRQTGTTASFATSGCVTVMAGGS